jgi:hypothetical protein
MNSHCLILPPFWLIVYSIYSLFLSCQRTFLLALVWWGVFCGGGGGEASPLGGFRWHERAEDSVRYEEHAGREQEDVSGINKKK